MNQTQILAPVAPDLIRVEELIRDYLASRDVIVDRVSSYIVQGRGKMLRPAIVLLTGGLFGPLRDSHYHLAALVEILHTATLVHDDIIDLADTRRGRPSANRVFGNEITVLMGDWLYMTAFQIAIARRSFPILDVLLDVTKRMVEGELIQLDVLQRIDLTVEEHLDIAARKTAHLFSACTRIAGLASDRSAEEIDQLGEIGLSLGLAFQLVDDILDFSADEKKLGKPVMNDLREGKVTLPVILLLQENNPSYKQLVQAMMQPAGNGAAFAADLRAALHRHDCLTRAMQHARKYAHQARRLIDTFTASPQRDSLAAMADYILDRRH
ncbi:MAG: polyprenyl synthetase family protein [Acidobacteria bacterium]|nr:polyprenyl synthetase family protein [Acidobacteriota bacterium]